MSARVIALAISPTHTMSKQPRDRICLLEGLGVEGDVHMGVTVKHRSRVAANPSAPNLRQVHLIHAELFDELRGKGFDIAPSQMGENITTGGIDLLALPRGTRLHLGDAVIEITGLRNPCTQLDGIQPGLMEALLERTSGGLIRKAGVMAIVIKTGDVAKGDPIQAELPSAPHERLKPV